METVIPKDIPLGLPAPFWLLEFLLLLSFTLHILFVNLMVGGSIMVVATFRPCPGPVGQLALVVVGHVRSFVRTTAQSGRAWLSRICGRSYRVVH